MNGLFVRFARWCPGALGLWLRQRLFPRHFQCCGRKVLFGRFVTVVAPERVSLGNNVVLNNGVVLDAGRAEAEAAIVLEDRVFIGTDSVLRAEGKGRVTIGAGANFSSACRVSARAPLAVGQNCLVAAYCELGEPAADTERMGRDRGRDEITVGDGGWLGVRMQILPGVAVGAETIVGAHALVSEDLPAYVVAVGRPARVIRQR